jgi:transcriptional regulator GlxA family with amidase domain
LTRDQVTRPEATVRRDPPPPRGRGGSGICWISVAQSYLSSCLEAETAPRAKELAVRLGLSRHRLARIFAGAAETTLAEQFMQERVARSQTLLIKTKLSLTAIAYKAGFGTRRSFFRAFRRATGQTPGEFRRAAQNVSMLEIKEFHATAQNVSMRR